MPKMPVPQPQWQGLPQKPFNAPAAVAKMPKAKLLQLLQAGIDLQRQQRFTEAERNYQIVLHHMPQMPEALNLMGTLALEAEEFAIAAEYFEKAAKQRPKDSLIQHNLGSTYMSLHQHDLAIRHFTRALDIKPGQMDTLCLIGSCYNRSSRAEEGLPFLERAQRLDPEHPSVRITIAEAYINLGRMDEAEQLLKICIEKNVAKPRAYQSLSALKKYNRDSQELAAVRAQLASPDHPEEALVPLRYAAAKMANDAKLYDESMEHFRFAKQKLAAKYESSAYDRRVEQMAAIFNPMFLGTRKNYGDSSSQPVFIVGMPRSGTTLTEQIISSHPSVVGAGELGEIASIAHDLGDSPMSLAKYAERINAMTAAESKELAQRYLKRISRYSRDALRITDKMPHNFEHVGLISLLFPYATIIHCRRDAIDNCLSCYMNAFSDAHAYNADFKKLGLYYRAYDRLMKHWHKVLPGRILDSKYEELVDFQEEKSRALISHADLPWDEACLNFTENDRTVTTISRWQVRQPIYKSSVKRWKSYEKHLLPLIDALGDLANTTSA